jgi:hypothetical protein
MFPRQRENTAIMEKTFYTRFVPRCYNKDHLAVAVKIIRSKISLQVTGSLSKRPVRRRPHQPVIIYAEKRMKLNENCNDKILLLDEQQTSSPLYNRDLNLSILKQLQPLQVLYTAVCCSSKVCTKGIVETNM